MRRFTAEQEMWLRENYDAAQSYAALTERFNAEFGTARTKDAVREKCTKRLGLFGMPNPTVYGRKPKEELPIGTIRRSAVGTYIKVRQARGARSSGYREPYWLPLQKNSTRMRTGSCRRGGWSASSTGTRKTSVLRISARLTGGLPRS